MTYSVAVRPFDNHGSYADCARCHQEYKPQMKVWPTVLGSLVVWGVGVWLGR